MSHFKHGIFSNPTLTTTSTFSRMEFHGLGRLKPTKNHSCALDSPVLFHAHCGWEMPRERNKPDCSNALWVLIQKKIPAKVCPHSSHSHFLQLSALRELSQLPNFANMANLLENSKVAKKQQKAVKTKSIWNLKMESRAKPLACPHGWDRRSRVQQVENQNTKLTRLC